MNLGFNNGELENIKQNSIKLLNKHSLKNPFDDDIMVNEEKPSLMGVYTSNIQPSANIFK